MGAPVLENAGASLCWAMIVSVHLLPCWPVHSCDVAAQVDILFLIYFDTWDDITSIVPGAACMIGAWLGAIPLPLDENELPWPIPNVHGAQLGACVGYLAANIIYVYQTMTAEKRI